MNTTFIYVLKEPDTGNIRYVGKANDPKKRLSAHLTDIGDTHKMRWIKSLPVAPELEILDEVPVEYWQQWEVAYIEFFREQGCDLVNTAPGGEGTSPSQETRKKISAANRGNKYNLGRKRSSEARENIRVAHLGIRPSEETRELMSLASRGKKKSEETRKNMSAAQRGNKKALGHKASEESLEKMRLAQTLRRDRERQEKILEEMWL